jgi:hypothetical protein
VEQHKLSIPILACHQHFLNDIGEDLLQDDHDRLRALFREVNLRSKLRTLARDLGRSVGSQIGQARQNLLQWQADTDAPLPEGATGLATVRAMVQWILDYLLRWRRLLKRLIPSLPPLAKRIGAMFGLGK